MYLTNWTMNGKVNWIWSFWIACRCVGAGDRQACNEFMNDLVRYFTNLCVSFRGRGLVVILLSQINREGAKRMAKSKVPIYRRLRR